MADEQDGPEGQAGAHEGASGDVNDVGSAQAVPDQVIGDASADYDTAHAAAGAEGGAGTAGGDADAGAASVGDGDEGAVEADGDAGVVDADADEGVAGDLDPAPADEHGGPDAAGAADTVSGEDDIERPSADDA